MTSTLDISSFARVFGVSKIYVLHVLILTFCSVNLIRKVYVFGIVAKAAYKPIMIL